MPDHYDTREEAIRIIGEDRVPANVLEGIVRDYGGRQYQTCQPDIPSEAIELILDAAVMAFDPAANSVWLRGAIAGVELALSTLLSTDEEPAENILREALAATPVGRRLVEFEMTEHTT